MEDFNLHLTGDVHAIGAAHNLAGAFLDNSLHHKNPLGHRPARDPLAARRRHQRPGAAPRRHRPRRPRGRHPARDRVRHHRRLRGHGGPRPRHRPVRPARPARPDRPRDDDRRQAGHRRGPRRRRRDDRAPARRDQAEPAPDARGRAGLRPRRPVRQHRPRQQLDHRRPAGAGDQRHRLHRGRLRGRHGRREVLRHQVPGVGSRARMRPSWSPRSGRSRCTAGSARSWPASRSIRRCSRRTSRRSGSAPRTWPSRSRTSRCTASRRSWRSTRSRPTRRPRSRRSARSRWRPARATRSSPRTSSTAAPGAAALAEAVWAATQDGSAEVRAALPGRDAAGRTRSRRSRPGSTAATGVEFLPAARKSLAAVRGPRLRPPADLHGQDPVLAQPRRGAQEPPDRVHRPDPRGPAVGRRRVHHAAVRGDADDAGAAVASRAARRSTSTPTGTSSACSRAGAGAERSLSSQWSGHVASAKQNAIGDPDQRARATPAPQAAESIGPSGSSSVGVVVMAVVVAVIVGRVMRDRSGVARASSVLIVAHRVVANRGHSGRPTGAAHSRRPSRAGARPVDSPRRDPGRPPDPGPRREPARARSRRPPAVRDADAPDVRLRLPGGRPRPLPRGRRPRPAGDRDRPDPDADRRHDHLALADDQRRPVRPAPRARRRRGPDDRWPGSSSPSRAGSRCSSWPAPSASSRRPATRSVRSWPSSRRP